MTDDPVDPYELLRQWLPPNADPARPLMTLATVSAEGWPNARTVLLSEYDDTGFWFHTDARSAKIAELDAVGRAALVLHRPELAVQVVVQGTVVAADADEEARAYAARSPYLRKLAWLNTAALAALPLAERQATWAGFPEPSAPPDTWTGRQVRPERITLWIGREDTASRRLAYVRSGDGWTLTILAG